MNPEAPTAAPNTVEALIQRVLDDAPSGAFDPATGDRLRDLVLRGLDADADDTAARSAITFCTHLRATIATLHLARFFAWDGDGDHHRRMIPRGYHRETGAIVEAEMQQWRADYRSLPPERQMLVATIVWLYQNGPDSTWLRRVPCTWGAAEALHYLRDAGCLPHWQRLVATCPGW